MPSLSVVIPTHPGREKQLKVAIGSAVNQTLPPVAVHVVVDADREGAAVTRNRALEQLLERGLDGVAGEK